MQLHISEVTLKSKISKTETLEWCYAYEGEENAKSAKSAISVVEWSSEEEETVKKQQCLNLAVLKILNFQTKKNCSNSHTYIRL